MTKAQRAVHAVDVVLAVTLPLTVSADGGISIDDFSGFEDVITFTEIDMESLGNPAEIGFGILVLNEGRGPGGAGDWKGNVDWSTLFDNIPGASLGKGLADNWGESNLTYLLPTGVTRFGLLLSTGPQTTWTVSFFDTSGIPIATTEVTTPAAAEAVFIGYESAALIGSVNILDTVVNTSVTIMDDVRFEVLGDLGACCFLDDTCTVMPEDACGLQAGFWAGSETLCEDQISECTCFLADTDGDGSVGISDFLLVLAQWGPCPPECVADVDGDGVVGILDFLLVLANWGPCT